MLSQKRLEQIREFLEKAQNPLFMFDNDVDGLVSFLLLRRACGKGKGVAIKSFPQLSAAYSRKLHEFRPDYVFVLDKNAIEKGFRESASQLGTPLIWIDHHPIPDYAHEENIFYFNPLMEHDEAEEIKPEPVSYICYKVTARKEDDWIAMLGCLADWYMPDFAGEFSKKYPDLFPFTSEVDATKALYKTEFGKIVKMLSFALMDRTSAVVQMLKNLLTIRTPYELLDINPKTASIHARYNQINKKYEKLLSKAKETVCSNKKILFFQYGGELSISGLLANELLYLYQDKIVIVAYIKGTKANVALRSKGIDIRSLAEQAIKGIEGSCGGHKEACGASLGVEDLPRFHAKLARLIEK